MELNPWEIALLLFATIGPLKVTLVAASMTAGADPEFVRRVALRSVVTASIVCVVFALFGEAILKTFKVSIPAFQVGGGLIVMLFALDSAVSGRRDDPNPGEESPLSSTPSIEMATCPLAVPLMASTSGLVAIVSTLAQRDDLKAVLFLTFVIAVIMVVNYGCLCSCQRISRLLGETALEVIGKLMGVILAALAVELMMAGLVGFGLITPPDKPGTAAAAAVAPPNP